MAIGITQFQSRQLRSKTLILNTLGSGSIPLRKSQKLRLNLKIFVCGDDRQAMSNASYEIMMQSCKAA